MPRLPVLNLPPLQAQIRTDGDTCRIYDPIRRAWVPLTPEEWVRQHFTAYLVGVLGYPLGHLGNEISLTVGSGRPRRCDTVVYGPDMRPLAIAEYKAPEVTVGQKVFDQIIRYNTTLHARCLMVTNGMRHYAIAVDKEGVATFLTTMPSYDTLLSLP